MNQSAPKSPHRQAPRPVDESPSKAIRLLTGLLVLALVAMVAVLLVQRTREHPSHAVLQADEQTNHVDNKASIALESTTQLASNAPRAVPPINLAVSSPNSAAVIAGVPPRPEPTVLARQSLAALKALDLSTGKITAEQAVAWREAFLKFIELGDEAVPAIREFLAQKTDLRFDTVAGGNQIGAATLRRALLEALTIIGGEQGVTGLLDALSGNTAPAEIAQITQSLEELAPNQYRPQELQVARAALAQAAAGQLEDEDVGPLFKLLHQLGGADATEDFLKFSSNWRYYSTIALANLPDGAGAASLIQMAQEADSTRSHRGAILQALTQVALTSPEAATALVAQARNSAIPFTSWINIASVLSGHELKIGSPPGGLTGIDNAGSNVRTWHLAFGNQNFYSSVPSEGLGPEKIQARLAVLDQLLEANANESAREMLLQARTALLKRGQPATPVESAPQPAIPVNQ